jgi:hypothetical protein
VEISALLRVMLVATRETPERRGEIPHDASEAVFESVLTSRVVGPRPNRSQASTHRLVERGAERLAIMLSNEALVVDVEHLSRPVYPFAPYSSQLSRFIHQG